MKKVIFSLLLLIAASVHAAGANWVNDVLAGANGGTGSNNSGKIIIVGGNVTFSGAFSTTITVSGTTTVSFPASGLLVGSADTGTVTNAMLAGSIANNKLSNSAITIAGTSTSLGGSITLDTIDNAIASNGLIVRTAANTRTARTITGTSGQITITNGDGVSGNPTVSLPSTISQATTFSAGTASVSSTTGTVIISGTGGLGVGGVIYSGGYNLGTSSSSLIASAFASSSSSGFIQSQMTMDSAGTPHTGVIAVAVGTGIIYGSSTSDPVIIRTNGTGRITIGATTGDTAHSSTTDSTSISTGSETLAGGLGVAKAAWIGGLANIAGVLTAANTTASTTTTTGGLIASGGFGLAGDMHGGGAISLDTLGKTLSIKSGTNGLSGTVTLIAGTGTITSTAIDANTVIVFSEKTAGGTPGIYQPLAAVTSGSAAVTSAVTDASTYNWVALKVN